jgi:dimethylargininase
MTAAEHPQVRPVIALVRDVSPRLADCVLTHVPRTPIDPALAAAQHDVYCEVLGSLGARVERVAPLPASPDGVFIEDTALVLDELAVIARPGAPSRSSETSSVARALDAYRPLATISAGSHLEGGDVVVAGRSIYVGRSGRTNESGIDELRSIAAPLGYTVTAVDLSGCLHLKSACTFVPPGIVLANPDWVSPDVFGDLTVVMVAPGEPYAANTITLGGVTLVGAAFPRTAAMLERRGIATRAVDLSELAKAEGALTCSSLIFARETAY